MKPFSTQFVSSEVGPAKRWYPWGLSVLVHTLLLTALLLVLVRREPAGVPERLRPAAIVLTARAPDDSPKYLQQTDVSQPTRQTAAPAAATAANSAAPDLKFDKDTSATSPLIAPGNLANELVFDAKGMANVPANVKMSSEFELTEAELEMIAADQQLIKSRQPIGDPASISLFGSGNLTGRQFVFVLDRSKSMGSSGLGVIEASRSELSLAIGQLEPHHEFQIVGYHSRTVTMSGRNLLPASPTNQGMVANFIGNLVAYGATQHENGLIVALAYQPDVVVLLTDGGYPELNSGQLKMVQQMAGSKTQIHCLQFGSGPQQESINFMTKLASQNRGSYQYIDVNQWKKK